MGVVTSVAYVESNDGQINIPTSNSSAYVLGAAYTAGPLVVRAAYKGKPSNVAASSGLTPKANFELAAIYDLGVARVGVAYDAASVEGTSTASAPASPATRTQAQARQLAELQTKSATGVSLHVPMGAASFGLGFYKRGVQKVTDVGVRYDLSKRTYLSAARSEKKGLFAADGYGGSQYRVAMSHTF
jgi:predicted porin